MSGHNVVSEVTGPKCPRMTEAILNTLLVGTSTVVDAKHQ